MSFYEFVGRVVAAFGCLVIFAGLLTLCIHLFWKAASYVYGIGWLWDAIAEHKKTHPIPRWTGMSQEKSDE